MRTIVFVAQASGDEASGYRAKFPDFPALVTNAVDIASLLRDARAGLLRELRALEAAGDAWPTPTTMTTFHQRAEHAGDTLLLVDVQVDDPPLRVSISIGERLLKRLDEAATAQDMSRSGFIAAALRHRLGEFPSAKPTSFETSAQRLQEEVASVARRVNDAVGPDSTFGRAVAELDVRALEGLRSLTSIIGGKQRKPGNDPQNAAEHGMSVDAGPEDD